jgi:iron complex outermembrane receptor protein
VKKPFILSLLIFLGSSDFFAQVDQTLTDTLALDEIVVTASRRREKITEAPATVQMLTTRDLSRFAGSNPLELVAGFRGIEYTRFGVDGITLNARGFNSAFNNRVLEIVDGRINMSALSGGLPVYNNGTMVKDDILRYEVVTGPQTALYGPNALNAVVNVITKDPRTYPGTTIAMSVGNQSQFSGRIRHAQQIDDRWAYKILGEFASGTEFTFYDSVYLTKTSPALPERDVDFDFSHLRGEGHVYYHVSEKADLILSGGGSSNDYLQVTTTGRNQFNGRTHAFLQLRYVDPSFYVNVYNTWGSFGENSYRIRDYTLELNKQQQNGVPYAMARDSAIIKSRFKEESQRLNAEVQYNTNFEKAGLHLIASMDYQLQRPNGYGITLVDSLKRISISQVGAVLQMEKSLPLDMKLVGALRYDHHESLGDFFAPKLTLVKKIGDGLARAGFAKAYAMPTILQQYANVNRSYFGNGGKGIKYIPNGTPYPFSEMSSNYTEPLKPEEVQSWELGYKGKISKPLYIDISGYYAKSNNFITPAISVPGRALEVDGITVHPKFPGMIIKDTLRNAGFTANFNYAEVNTWGIDVGMTWAVLKGIQLSINYSWIDSDITDSIIENDANRNDTVSLDERSLNAPHHRGSASLLFTNMLKDKFQCKLGARYVQQYDFYSGNQIGTSEGEGKKGNVTGNEKVNYNFDWGPLGDFLTFDFSAGYSFNSSISANLNITNIFNSRQIEFVGSPSIGRLIVAGVRVDLK